MKRGPLEQNTETPSAKRSKHDLGASVPLQEEKAIHLPESTEMPPPLLWCGVAKKVYPESKLTALRQKQWDEIQYIKNHWNETLAGINRADWAELDAITEIAEDMRIYEEREALLDRLNAGRIREKTLNSRNGILNLTRMQLSRFPKRLLLAADLSTFWENLNTLIFSENNLSCLPKEIGHLISLKTLMLDQNQINELPVEIGKLNQLEILFLNHNQLTYLPVEIGNLYKVSMLMLDENRLHSLPNTIENLKKLETLFLNNNQLTELPENIGSLNITNWITLYGNHLTKLSNELIQQFGEDWAQKTLANQKQPIQTAPEAAQRPHL